MATNNYNSPIKVAIIRVLPFLNNPKDLDQSWGRSAGAMLLGKLLALGVLLIAGPVNIRR